MKDKVQYRCSFMYLNRADRGVPQFDIFHIYVNMIEQKSNRANLVKT